MLCQKSKDQWVPDIGLYSEVPRENNPGNPMQVIGEMGQPANGGEWMRMAMGGGG